jgi:predicted enzyme related to lactoylglutathione lyase
MWADSRRALEGPREHPALLETRNKSRRERAVTNGGNVTLRIGSAAVDCADLDRMSKFWSEVLGYRTSSTGEGWVYLVDPKQRRPGLFLQQVPDPTPGKNRWNIDLYGPDEEAEAARVEAHGATRVRRFEKNEGAITGTILIVMRDVEGNEFCIVRSR